MSTRHVNALALKGCDAADLVIFLRSTGTGVTCSFENFVTR